MTPATPAVPDRGELQGLVQQVVHPGSATKPAVLVLERGGARIVVKDVRPLHPLLRALYGRRVLRREERALAHLAGAAGAPRLIGRIDADALCMEFRPGLPFRGKLGGPDPERYRRACRDLEAKIDELHARGVVHLDLRQRRNILVDEVGDVSLLDFESALRLGHHGWKGWLLRRLRRFDRSAGLKFRARYAPDSLSPAEWRRLRRASALRSLWVFHHLGAVLRRLLGKRDNDADEGSGEASDRR